MDKKTDVPHYFDIGNTCTDHMQLKVSSSMK